MVAYPGVEVFIRPFGLVGFRFHDPLDGRLIIATAEVTHDRHANDHTGASDLVPLGNVGVKLFGDSRCEQWKGKAQ